MAVVEALVIKSGKVQRRSGADTINGASALLTYTATNSNASAVTIGQPVYVDGAGSVDLAKADASGTARVIGVVKDASIASAASGETQYAGVLASADWTAVTGGTTLTAGANYYLSAATAGQLTATPPDATGQQLVCVGHAISTTELAIEIARPIGL